MRVFFKVWCPPHCFIKAALVLQVILAVCEATSVSIFLSALPTSKLRRKWLKQSIITRLRPSQWKDLFFRCICLRFRACVTTSRWPTATARTMFVDHLDGVAPAQVWSPSSRPTTLVNIMHRTFAAHWCHSCMLRSHRFNDCGLPRCTGGVIGCGLPRLGVISWPLSKC